MLILKKKFCRYSGDRNGSGTALNKCSTALGSNSSLCGSNALHKLLTSDSRERRAGTTGGFLSDKKRETLKISHTAPEELLLQAWKVPQAFFDQEPKWGLNSRNTHGQWELRGFSQPDTVSTQEGAGFVLIFVCVQAVDVASTGSGDFT